jgi:hypothetical protein
MARKRSINSVEYNNNKYIKLGLTVQDLSSEITTNCLTAMSAFCYE